jgi:hypothetical protein
MSVPSAKERVIMALAEAGYPHARVAGTEDFPRITHKDYRLIEGYEVPLVIVWRSFRLAMPNLTPCFECFENMGKPKCGSEECKWKIEETWRLATSKP